MRLDHDWIAAHVPHQGRMCLLDTVLNWNPTLIECSAGSHRATDHPLRAHGRLGAASLIEYAAQAMAVHAALLESPTSDAARRAAPRIGMLTSVRSMELKVAELDALQGDLSIRAERLHGDVRGALYVFHIRCAGELVAQGRASVLLT